MSASSTPASSDANPPPPRRQTGSPLQILRAITNPDRYAILRELADGSYPPVIHLAKKLDCHPDMMGRHLQRMHKVGLLVRVKPADNADRRSKYYQIPAEFRATLPDGRRILDFGACALIFDPVAKSK